MKSPTDDEVDDVLDRLQRTRIEIIDQWMSDAEKQGLPVSNQHDSRGAPVLNRDEVLRRSYPDYARVK